MKKTYALIGFLVLALSSIVGFGIYYVSSEYIALDQQSVNEAKSLLAASMTLTPVEGANTNFLDMVKDALSESIRTDMRGTQVKIISSTSPQIAADGTITYGNAPTTATVTIKIKKRRSSTTQEVTVDIPAKASVSEPTPTPEPTPTAAPTPIPTTTTVPAGALNVKNYGAKGDGIADDTAAINSAILAAPSGGTVYVPGGTYMVVAPDSTPYDKRNIGAIKMKSNVNLVLASNATIKVTSNSYSVYNTVYFGDGVTNASISGGKIEGDRYSHLGTTGESGHAITIHGGINITISNIHLSKCWGDGIYISGKTSSTGYAQNVNITNVNITDCRRNGISVISVDGLTIKDSAATNINGTEPKSGIDLEPNNTTQILRNVLIDNFHTEYCADHGIEIWFGAGTLNNVELPIANVSNVKIINYSDIGSGSKINNATFYTSRYDISIL